jgi:hypothetical protein
VCALSLLRSESLLCTFSTAQLGQISLPSHAAGNNYQQVALIEIATRKMRFFSLLPLRNPLATFLIKQSLDCASPLFKLIRAERNQRRFFRICAEKASGKDEETMYS